jgi:hypothetical protein
VLLSGIVVCVKLGVGVSSCAKDQRRIRGRARQELLAKRGGDLHQQNLNPPFPKPCGLLLGRAEMIHRPIIAKILIFLSIPVFAGILFLAGHQRSTGVDWKEGKWTPPSAQTFDRHVMRGLRYNSNIHGDTTLNIEADEFRIGKKKIGFLRFGLLNEAELTNAKIRFVRNPGLPHEATRSMGSLESNIPVSEQVLWNPKNSIGNSTDQRILLDSARAFLKEISMSSPFLGLSKSRIICLRIAPIDFQFCEADLTLIRISAGSASLDTKNKKIVFSETVRAQAGEEHWRGEELVIDLVSGTVTSEAGNKFLEEIRSQCGQDSARVAHKSNGFKKVIQK